MPCRMVYVIIASSTKNRILQGEKIRFVRSINPETLNYEKERVMNCFGTREQAEKVRKELGADKKVSIMALSIPENCILPRLVKRNGRSKQDAGKLAYEKFGCCNYFAPMFNVEGADRYLVLIDISCIMEIYDPEEKKECRQKEKVPQKIKKEYQPEAERTVLEYKTVQTAEPGGRTTGQMSFWVGVILGIVTGMILTRAATFHPLLTFTLLLPIAAVIVTVLIYYKYLFKKD